jgi:hypothetical protein
MSSKSKQCKITNIEAELGYVRARQIEIIAVLDSKKVHKTEKFLLKECLILLTKLEVPVFQLRVRYKKAERKRKLRQKLRKVKI